MSEENNTYYYTNSYDKGFRKIEHYRRYRQMMPFVGKNYRRGGILLLGESHYLPEKSTIHLDATQWYEGDANRLNSCEKGWTDTRAIVDSHVRGGKAPFLPNIVQALCDATGQEYDCSIMQRYCFMNAFQRPATTGESIGETDLDIVESGEVIRQVMEILSPGHAFFISMKAARVFQESIAQQDVKVGATQHASSPWWNRKSGTEELSGRERFIRLIRTVPHPTCQLL